VLLKDKPEHFTGHVCRSGTDVTVRYGTGKMKLTYTFLMASDQTRVTVFSCHVLTETTALLHDKLSTLCGKSIAPFVKTIDKTCFCQITGVMRIFF